MNYSIHDDFLDEETCLELIEYSESSICDDNYYDKLNDINEKLLSVILTDFNENMYIDNIIVRCYDTMESKMGMSMHIDNVNWGNLELRQRTFSASIVLNKNFVGGNFKFQDDDKIRNISPNTGQLVLIRSKLMHGVDIVIVGKRYVLLIWTRGDYKGDVRRIHLTRESDDESLYR